MRTHACERVSARGAHARAARRPPERVRGAVRRTRAALRGRGVGRTAGARAHRRGEARDVRAQRRVRRLVPGGHVPDEYEDGRARALRVVKVCQAIREARAEVEEDEGGAAGHPRVPVRRARRDVLVQAQDRPDRRRRLECVDNVHLRRACARQRQGRVGGDARAHARTRRCAVLGARGWMQGAGGSARELKRARTWVGEAHAHPRVRAYPEHHLSAGRRRVRHIVVAARKAKDEWSGCLNVPDPCFPAAAAPVHS